MSLLAKIFVVLQALLVMVYLGMSASLYQHRRDWRTSYQKLKHRYNTAIDVAKRELEARKSEIEARQTMITTKESELRTLKTELDQALASSQRNNQMYREEQQKLATLTGNFERLSNNLNQALQDLERARQRIDTTEGLLATANVRRETAEGQVARLTSLKTNLETDLSDLRKEFTSARTLLREKELMISMAENAGVNFSRLLPGPPVPAIDGRVVAVKTDIDPPLVLLSVGSDDKVERGFEFAIYQNSKFKGKVVVERVLPDSAGCRVLFTVDGESITAGDSAATRLQ